MAYANCIGKQSVKYNNSHKSVMNYERTVFVY